MADTKIQCSRCGNSKRLTEYYNSYSPIHEYYGKTSICKKCIFDMVDEKDLRSIQTMLRMLDKPFIKSLWDASTVEADKQDRSHFRTYLKNVVMPQHKEKTWNDSDFDGVKNSKEDNPIPTGDKKDDGDKIYSREWLGYYYHSEIDYLKEYLSGLNRDFRILTKSHQDYAKKIAKASLHMDKCFQDMQDGVKGSEKRYKEAKEVFDTLSKSAQFSEDKRGQNDVSLGSFSQITEMVENNTYVYEHKNDLDKDNYDKLLEEFSHIGKSI